MVLVAEARDSSAATITGTPIGWTSLDTARVRVSTDAQYRGVAVGGSQRGPARLVATLVTGQTDTRGEDMPLWTLLFPIPFCFFLVAIEFCRYLFGLDDMYGDRTDVRENV